MTSLATMAVLIALAGILSMLVMKGRNWLLAICAAGAWAVLISYIVANPPANMVAGDTPHQMLVIVLSGVAMAILITGIQRGRTMDSEGISDEDINNELIKRNKYDAELIKARVKRYASDTQFSESTESYKDRIHRKLHPETRRRR